VEAKGADIGELIYSEDRGIVRRFRRTVIFFIVTTLALGAVFLAISYGVSTEDGLAALVFLSGGIAGTLFYIWARNRFRPLVIHEKGFVDHFGRFVPYRKLRVVHLSVASPPHGCSVWFSKSRSGRPTLVFRMVQDEVDGGRHIELARRFENLGFLVFANRHPKAEDHGLVDMVKGEVLLEEPSGVFKAWRRRALIASELIVLSPLLFVVAIVVWIDLSVLGYAGPLTNIIAPLVLALSALLALLIYFLVPKEGWRLYEKALELHSLSEHRPHLSYEECSYAVLRQPGLIGTGVLRVFLKGYGVAGDIPVGERKHAYGDVDLLVELFESKGVSVER
jgi:hypothetical protein